MRNGPAGKAPDGQQATAAAQATARAQTPGGASGLPQTTQTAATQVKANVAAARPQIKVKKYRVLNGGVVVFNGMRTALRAGKEVDERSYDLAHLKRQGIRLEEIQEDAPPEPTPDATDSNPFPGSGEYQPHASQAVGPIPAPHNVAPKS